MNSSHILPHFHHDCKPSHNTRPQYLIDAGGARDAAWDAHNTELDAQIAEGEWDLVVLEALRTKALMTEQYYGQQYARWQESIARQLADVDECTCKPTGDACAYCQGLPAELVF